MSALAPTVPRERLESLDVLRGFALCGVMIANASWAFSGRGFASDDPAYWLDTPTQWIVDVLISGKAMTLLTCLFGLGFALQTTRAAAAGHNANRLHARRLAALLIIGMLHATVLWWGDVTWSYALAGFALLLFRRRRDRTLLLWAAALTVIPQSVALLPGVSEALAPIIPRPGDPPAFRAEFLAALRGDDYLTIVWAHVRQAAYHHGRNIVWFFPWLLGRFLLGAVAGRRGLFDHDGADQRPLFRRLVIGGFVCGVAGTGVHLWLRSDAMRGRFSPLIGKYAVIFSGEIGVLGLVAFYVGAAVLLMQRPVWRRALRLVAPVGRMPLTTYLSQSLLCMFVFYGWGLGLSGRVGAAGCLVITLLLCCVQIVVSHLWLRRFRFGPTEWLWRRLTYGRRATPVHAPSGRMRAGA